MPRPTRTAKLRAKSGGGTKGWRLPFQPQDACGTRFQRTVLLTPELVLLLAQLLSRRDLSVVYSTCQLWRTIWMPHLYATVLLRAYRKTGFRFEIAGPFIQALTLELCNAEDVLHVLQQPMPKLSSLILVHGNELSVSTAFVARASSLSQLRRLCINQVWRGNKKDIKELSVLRAIQACTPLIEEVTISSYADTLSALLLVIKNCRHLRKLAFPRPVSTHPLDPNDHTEDHVFEPGWVNTSLRSLSVTLSILSDPVNGPTDQETGVAFGIKQVFDRIPELQYLRLDEQHVFEPADFDYICQRVPKLDELDVQSMASVGLEHDPAATNTLRRCCPMQLKYLHINGLQCTDQRDIAYLPPLQKLEQLKLSHVAISDMVLMSSFASTVPSLRVLNLSYCRRLRAAGALAVLTHAPGLEHVNLQETLAGSIELFEIPWACQDSLRSVHLEIVPSLPADGHSDGLGIYSMASFYFPVGFGADVGPYQVSRYTAEEWEVIRGRLHSLSRLEALKLKGSELSFDVFARHITPCTSSSNVEGENHHQQYLGRSLLETVPRVLADIQLRDLSDAGLPASHQVVSRVSKNWMDTFKNVANLRIRPYNAFVCILKSDTEFF